MTTSTKPCRHNAERACPACRAWAMAVRAADEKRRNDFEMIRRHR